MKPTAVLLIVLTVAAFAATVVSSHVGGLPLVTAFTEAFPLTKLADLVLLLVLLAVAVVGLAARSGGKSGASPVLGVAVWSAPALGALVCLQGALMIWSIAQKVHTTEFRIMAPSVAEALLPLSLGLLAGALAAILGGRAKQP